MVFLYEGEGEKTGGCGKMLVAGVLGKAQARV